MRRSRRHERPKSVGSGTVPSDAPAAYGANATGPGRWTGGEVSVGSKAKTRHAVALASACEHRAPRHRGYDHAQAAGVSQGRGALECQGCLLVVWTRRCGKAAMAAQPRWRACRAVAAAGRLYRLRIYRHNPVGSYRCLRACSVVQRALWHLSGLSPPRSSSRRRGRRRRRSTAAATRSGAAGRSTRATRRRESHPRARRTGACLRACASRDTRT